MGFKDPNWICPRLSHSHIWIIKQDLWKAKLCVWKIICELFEEWPLPAHPFWGRVFALFHMTPQLFTIIFHFLCFLFSHCLLSALVLFFFCLLSVGIIFFGPLPSALLPSALNSFPPVPPHPEGSLGELLAPDPDFGAWSSGCAVNRMTPFFLMSGGITNEKTSWEGWSAYVNVSIYNTLNYLCSNKHKLNPKQNFCDSGLCCFGTVRLAATLLGIHISFDE